MGYYMGIDLGGTNIKAGVVDDAFVSSAGQRPKPAFRARQKR